MIIYTLVERQPSKTVNLTNIYHPSKPRTIKVHHSVGKQRHLTSSLPGLHYYLGWKKGQRFLVHSWQSIQPWCTHRNSEKGNLSHMAGMCQTLHSQDAVKSSLRERSAREMQLFVQCDNQILQWQTPKCHMMNNCFTDQLWWEATGQGRGFARPDQRAQARLSLSVCGRVGSIFKQTGESFSLLQDCLWVLSLLAMQPIVCRFCPSDSPRESAVDVWKRDWKNTWNQNWKGSEHKDCKPGVQRGQEPCLLWGPPKGKPGVLWSCV